MGCGTYGILEHFFKNSFEVQLKNYSTKDNLETDNAVDYLNELIDTPVEQFMEYIFKKFGREPIVAADVFQFSSLEDATLTVCSKIKNANNPGLTFLEIGKLLLDDNVDRKAGAYTKYGENHIKAAELLGLAYKGEDKLYYLSFVGMALNTFPEKKRNQLITRLILKNKLVIQLLLFSLNGKFDLEAFLYDLSETTYQRRRSNIKAVIAMLNASDEYDFKTLTQNIEY